MTGTREQPPSDGLSLIVEPSRARAGAQVTLKPDGRGADDLTGGVLSYFQALDAGQWRDLYLLISPLRSVAGPEYKRLGEEAGITGVPAVAILGPVRVVVPPVTAGTYRIRRGFFGSRSSPPGTEVMLDAPIDVIP